MRKGFPWRTIIGVPLIWTAGILAIWSLARVSLDSGVTDADIQECAGEGFIPADECEETLRELEDEDAVIAVPLLLVLWFAGLLLLSLVWLATRQKPTNSE